MFRKGATYKQETENRNKNEAKDGESCRKKKKEEVMTKDCHDLADLRKREKRKDNDV